MRIVIGISILVLGLSACSQDPEPIATPEPSVVLSTPSIPAPDPCEVLDRMEAQFSGSVASFIANPSQDALVVLENEFNAQVELLYILIESLDPGSVTTEQLDNALRQKDEAVRQFTESTQTDNILKKGVLLAGAVVAAQDAVSTAQELLTTLSTDLSCP